MPFQILEPIDRKKPKREKSFETLDIETRKWTKFICVGIYDGAVYTEYRSLKPVVERIYNSTYAMNIFSHFGGGFDMLFLLEEICNQKIQIINIIPRGSLILSIKLQGKYKTHTLRDSSALLPFSLKRLTEAFDVKTKKGEYDHSKNRGYSKELSDYLRMDCLGLYEVLQKFYSNELVASSGASYTLASQAQKIMRCYLKKPIAGLSDEKNEFMREACHGGRTEIFKPKGRKLYEYDVNSLYPYVMQENAFPDGWAIWTTKYKSNKMGIYDCEIRVPKNTHIPCIPVKMEHKLLFPKGNFKSRITAAEIEYARSLGYKIKVLEGYYFTSKTRYFKEFVSALYKIRQKSVKNSVDNIITKLILNSSYGKFIIRPEKTNLVLDRVVGGTHFRDVKINGKLYEIYSVPVVLNTFIHCGIGAYILAYARIHMHKKMNKIAKNVYYTDTDSIWTDKKLKSSDKIGDLKLEKPGIGSAEGYDQVCFLLPKTYIAQNSDYKKIAMKGFDRRKIQHFTYKDFDSALSGEMILSVKHDEGISKLKGALMKGKFVALKPSSTKTIKAKYNKRILNLNKNTSEAITL